jgi:hypothetical protein
MVDDATLNLVEPACGITRWGFVPDGASLRRWLDDECLVLVLASLRLLPTAVDRLKSSGQIGRAAMKQRRSIKRTGKEVGATDLVGSLGSLGSLV